MSSIPYIHSIINEGSTFRGDIESDGILHINGDFYGKIKSTGDIIVGATGRIECNIKARRVSISGIVKGDIEALETVHLYATAVVIGNINSASAVIELGGIVTGQLNIADSQERMSIFAEEDPAAETQLSSKEEYSAWQS